MGKSNKTITKCCPFCELQVAVACKSCPGCKHSFYNAKRLTLSQSIDDHTLGGRRRTERVKREKPNYYDASEFEKKTKKKRIDRNSSDTGRERGRPNSQPLKKKRKKKLCKSNKEHEEEDQCFTLTNDKKPVSMWESYLLYKLKKDPYSQVALGTTAEEHPSNSPIVALVLAIKSWLLI